MPMRAAARRIEQAFIGVILVALFVLGFQTWRQHVAGRNVCRGTHLLAQIEINNHTNVIKESNALILNGGLPKATQDTSCNSGSCWRLNSWSSPMRRTVG